ncbi:uncharacterized protein [Triticum aestivum]|uniref:uncharacterized protein isoform X2 n=1 Tax=Triticum aestivum TaxID=4565 RepID=UPI001D02E8D8|nr:uncharacterized protein LOC123114213 isoform X2 [Triticum aestivum]XP_044391533.1 uncharacterized protein LOC123114213 isoform X3 [Triticum aestivum]
MAPRAALLLLLLLLNAAPALSSAAAGTIVFTTLGRTRYAFDVYALPLAPSLSASPSPAAGAELRLTDGASVNYNANFAPSSAALLFVSERNGSLNVYLSPVPPSSSSSASRREAREVGDGDSSPPAAPTPLLPWDPVALRDRPALTRDGSRLVYVSTAVPAAAPRRSWAAVYATHLPSGRTTRLTPPGVADFSPAVSPSGDWTAAASPGERGWAGEVQDLRTDVYVFRTSDGSRRTLLVRDGGWPCWADESTLFFHRRDSDGWYSVYRAKVEVSDDGLLAAASSVERRVARGAGARRGGHQAARLGLPAHRGDRPELRRRQRRLLRGDQARGAARAPLQPVRLAGRRAGRVPPVPGQRERGLAAAAGEPQEPGVGVAVQDRRVVPFLLAGRQEDRLRGAAGAVRGELRRLRRPPEDLLRERVPHVVGLEEERGDLHQHRAGLREREHGGGRGGRVPRRRGRRRQQRISDFHQEAHNRRREQRVPVAVAGRQVGGVPVGEVRAQEPVHHGRGGRRGRRHPAPDGRAMDRHHVQLVAGRRVDRLRLRPAQPGGRQLRHPHGAPERHRAAEGGAQRGRRQDEPPLVQPRLEAHGVHLGPRRRLRRAHFEPAPLPALRRDLHRQHRRLGAAAAHAQLVRGRHAVVDAALPRAPGRRRDAASLRELRLPGLPLAQHRG